MRWRLRRDLVGDTSARELRGVRIIVVAAKKAALSKLGWAAVALAIVLVLSWGMAGLLLIPAAFATSFVVALMAAAAAISGRHQWRQRPIELPDPLLFSDIAVQSIVRRLHAARARIASAVHEGPRGLQFDLAAVQRSTPAIERRIIVLAARAEYLGCFLATVSVPEITAALNEATTHAAKVVNPQSALAHRRVVEGNEDHLKTVRQLETEKEQLLATMEYLLGTLEALPAKLTRVQALRLAYSDADDAWDSVCEATHISDELSAFEEAFERQATSPRATGKLGQPPARQPPSGN